MAETILYEDAEMRVVRVEAGADVGYRQEAKVGSADWNRDELRRKLRAAAVYFAGVYADFDTLTPAQAEAFRKNTARTMANLCRLAAGLLDDAGV